jgi:4-hydroxybenzoate polyprenyltransferase
MVSHMAIMPLVDLYATACDWAPRGTLRPPHGLFWFLLVSLFNGMVVEIGRKIRVPQDEETGVETYSFLWGRKRAITVWLLMMSATAALACLAAYGIGFAAVEAVILAGVLIAANALSVQFLETTNRGAGKRIEIMAGIWSLLLYLSLGVLPIALRAWGHQ